MKLLFDLFPVILFFVAFKYSEKNPELAASWIGSLLGAVAVDVKQAPILLASVVVIAATVAQIAWVWFRHGKVDKMLWVSLVLVAVFGGMTLIFQDETFIKWKPTILYWVFAGSMSFAALVLKKNAMKTMLGEQLTLPEAVWSKVNYSWVAFFIVMGFIAQRQKPLVMDARDWGWMVGLGIFGYYLASYLDFLGLRYISAGLERLILFLYPTIVILLSALFLGKPITRRGPEAGRFTAAIRNPVRSPRG